MKHHSLVSLSTACALAACGDMAELTPDQTTGSDPTLPPPNETLIPTLNIAPAIGWSKGVKPLAPSDLIVTAFAQGLDHPRWLYVLTNGDVLVAETNAPERPEDGAGIKAFFKGLVMERAGAAVPSANRITLLRDADHDGVAETRAVLLQGLNSPVGMALVGNDLFVANTDAVMRFTYRPGDTNINTKGTKLADLPGGPLNHHWTKGLIASRDGRTLYASVGSNSNAAENGIEKEVGRAGIIEIDIATGRSRLFASGLRNPVGMAIEPQSGALWTVVNERDELGSDLVPDYLTSVKDGGFYGWPYSYFGRNIDERVQPPAPDLVEKAIVPDYALGNHVAPLGLTFASGARLPARFASGAFVGEHGSWNREPLSGYKVVFVPFASGKPNGKPVDVLTGFVDKDGNAQGRPVGVAIDRDGGLLVADDVGNAVWRVSANAPQEAMAR
ncbi:MAG: sorbosone dehydrogenase family protein [Alphaproteobacteria bacterium]|nr:sorbosone dehydrogenase family protein [Alphaproteobacteria bacterium]